MQQQERKLRRGTHDCLCCIGPVSKMFLDTLQNGSSNNTIGIILALLIILNILKLIKTLNKYQQQRKMN